MARKPDFKHLVWTEQTGAVLLARLRAVVEPAAYPQIGKEFCPLLVKMAGPNGTLGPTTGPSLVAAIHAAIAEFIEGQLMSDHLAIQNLLTGNCLGYVRVFTNDPTVITDAAVLLGYMVPKKTHR